MPKGWTRFGVPYSPYEGPVLDCVREQGDVAAFIPLHGAHETSFLDYAKKQTKNRRGTLTVVTGASGSGKTVIARRLIYHYLQANSLPLNKFAFAEYDPKDNVDAKQVVLEIVHRLITATVALGKAFEDGPAKSLEDKLRSALSGDWVARIDEGLRAYSESMKNAGAGFGFIMEGVQTGPVLSSLATIVQNTRGTALTFCTLDESNRDSLSTLTPALSSQLLEIRLYPIPGPGVQELASKLWAGAGANLPLPLDDQALDNVFSSKPRTVGRTLFLLSNVMDLKLLHAGDGDLWPADEGLRVTDEQLRSYIEYLDRWKNG